jgi:hypothetical protein
VLIHQYADSLVKRASIQDEAASGCLKSNWTTAVTSRVVLIVQL